MVVAATLRMGKTATRPHKTILLGSELLIFWVAATIGCSISLPASCASSGSRNQAYQSYPVQVQHFFHR
ncbi:hypothetical protein DAEQUDRAFT_730383 [Daedalea quercina L-15889]|uniref:Uncharacterized protein n=1 Tax=Daedalea quercina L-15889 TaxID=1314783 RepID=A0A165N207_9APHY|nr:hypothetical protein DAEQUDRAFT_730383 [Daedalea quercina L-15889]